MSIPNMTTLTDPVLHALSQDELKIQVGRAALRYVQAGDIIGVGTGSTVNKFIEALAVAIQKKQLSIAGAVSSSQASTVLMQSYGIKVLPTDCVTRLGVYIDGADEIDTKGYMIKGGGAALTREKIIASMAERFICIADESKYVQTLGAFAVPVEVIPMAACHIKQRFMVQGAHAALRMQGGHPLVTDNGQYILDVTGLQITDPLAFEYEVNQWAGVVTVGVFAQQRATLCLLGTRQGVQLLNFEI